MTNLMLSLSATVLAALQAPVAPDTTLPHVRAHHATAFHPGERRILMTSGSSPLDGGQRYFMGDDTWGFDGRRWTRISRSDREMSGVRLAWDSRRERLLSFGGYLGGSTSIGDLRMLDNGRWRTIDSLPVMATAEAGFVYDDRRDRLVAFGGGHGRGQAYGDTWEYDGTRWTQWVGTSPPARQSHAMVFDTRRGVSVVFGGMSSAPPGERPTVLQDLWEFNGAAWRQVQFADGPSPRHAVGATYDSSRGVVLIFGGLDSTGMRNDLWAFDGASWEKLAEGGPPPRAMGALAYDAARDRVVLFGGRRGWPDDLNDTWEWDGRAWREIVR